MCSDTSHFFLMLLVRSCLFRRCFAYRSEVEDAKDAAREKEVREEEKVAQEYSAA